ncbi:hypothetical protein SUGI_0749980 [Cryptomeria japonica]|nr:hypothetical protein SUGI_0749980 [Cryptomeria japonica]
MPNADHRRIKVMHGEAGYCFIPHRDQGKIKLAWGKRNKGRKADILSCSVRQGLMKWHGIRIYAHGKKSLILHIGRNTRMWPAGYKVNTARKHLAYPTSCVGKSCEGHEEMKSDAMIAGYGHQWSVDGRCLKMKRTLPSFCNDLDSLIALCKCWISCPRGRQKSRMRRRENNGIVCTQTM